ncbi:teichoic acid transport system permease protein [Enteractinococcus coprophilus]|uniref:Transport permease protein n=2 Tax=Enteractinococcus coprophilus TaxID=1027633 RepID=A0A543AGI3_9MICC|nr:teichoic acid transport system permease protein [Enteractinococcus coprophilus]
MNIVSKSGSPNPKRVRRVLSEDDERFLRDIEKTHLAKDPSVEDLFGETQGLEPIGEKASLPEYFKELWQRRHFIWRESKNKVLNQTSNTFLGPFWLVINPLLLAAFYWVVFGIVLGISRGMDNFVAFIIIGILMFRFSSGIMSQATKAIESSRSMIRAFSYPRAAIPISLVVRETLGQFIVMAVMIVMILAIPPHVSIDATWLLFPVVFLLHILINAGFAFFFSRLGYKMPDFAQAMSFIVRILMYGSGVIFPVERFIENELALTIVKANPIYMLLDSYRSILMENTVPAASTWLGLAAWAIGLAVLGFWYFWKGEEEYARERR